MENIIINVNSIFRDTDKYPSANHFKISLPETLKNISYIKLTSLEIVDVNYVFTEIKKNNKFKIIVGTDEYDVILEDGNYTSSTLITTLQSRLDEINNSLSFNISVDINIYAAKLFFTSDTTDTFTIDFTRDGYSEYPPIKYFLGFENDSYTGTSVNANYTINLNGVNYAFLCVNDIENVIDNRVSNAFTKIIYETGRFNSLFSKGKEFNSKDKVFRSPINLEYLEIKLVDYLGNLLELSNFNFSFTLEVGYIYDINLYKKINNGGNPNGDNRLLFKY